MFFGVPIRVPPSSMVSCLSAPACRFAASISSEDSPGERCAGMEGMLGATLDFVFGAVIVSIAVSYGTTLRTVAPRYVRPVILKRIRLDSALDFPLDG